jgi:hypothetical protein
MLCPTYFRLGQHGTTLSTMNQRKKNPTKGLKRKKIISIVKENLRKFIKWCTTIDESNYWNH